MNWLSRWLDRWAEKRHKRTLARIADGWRLRRAYAEAMSEAMTMHGASAPTAGPAPDMPMPKVKWPPPPEIPVLKWPPSPEIPVMDYASGKSIAKAPSDRFEHDA